MTDRQTDGRRHIANMNMSSRSLKSTKYRWLHERRHYYTARKLTVSDDHETEMNAAHLHSKAVTGRTHVFVRYMLSPVRPYVRLSVCLWSVTFVRPTQQVEIFGNVSISNLVHWPSVDIEVKFYGDRPRETPPSGGGGVKRKRGSQI